MPRRRKETMLSDLMDIDVKDETQSVKSESEDIEPEPSAGKRRGRPVATGPVKKRKVTYSDNKHSVKARERANNLTGFAAERERRGRRDRSDVSFYTKRLKNTTEYEAMSVSEKQAAKSKVKADRLLYRTANGLSQAAWEQRTGFIGNVPSQEATITEDAEGWYDDTESNAEMDPKFVAHRDMMDELQFGPAPEMTRKELEQRSLQQRSKGLYTHQLIEFRGIQMAWVDAIQSLIHKLRHANTCDNFFQCKHTGEVKIPLCDEEGYLIYGFPKPHQYFTRKEIAAWRNLAAHHKQYFAVPEADFEIQKNDSDGVRMFKTSNKASEWVELPGPSRWWDDYDLKEHGWLVAKDPVNARMAYDIVNKDYGSQIPDNSKLLSMEENELECISEEELEKIRFRSVMYLD